MLDNNLIEALNLMKGLPRYKSDSEGACATGPGLDYPTVLKVTYNYAASYLHAVELGGEPDPVAESDPCELQLAGQIPDSTDALSVVQSCYVVAMGHAEEFVEADVLSVDEKMAQATVRLLLPQMKELLEPLQGLSEPSRPGFRVSDTSLYKETATTRQAYNHSATILGLIANSPPADPIELGRLWRIAVSYLAYATRDPSARDWVDRDPSMQLLSLYENCREMALGKDVAPPSQQVEVSGEIDVGHSLRFSS
jgi:hypothetical protein